MTTKQEIEMTNMILSKQRNKRKIRTGLLYRFEFRPVHQRRELSGAKIFKGGWAQTM
jgi:hypothetical protein